jgi:hypothetical protein
MAKKAVKKKLSKKAKPLFPGFFKDKLAKADPKIAKASRSYCASRTKLS